MKTIQNTLKELFYKSPDWLKGLYGVLPVSMKFGKKYVKELSLIKNSYDWTQSQCEDFLSYKVISAVKLAYDHIPFYQNLYDEHGVDIAKIQSISDIKELPIVTKEALISSNQQIKNKKANALNSYKANTGGSSGQPFSFLLPSSHYYRAWAYKCDMWGRTGYNVGDPVLSFRGHKIDDELYIHQKVYNFYYVDSYKLNSTNVSNLINLIKNKEIKYLHGYPSNLVRFSELIGNNSVSSIKGIFPCSEKVDNYKKEQLRQNFNAKIQPSYEQSEMTILASYGWNSDKYYFYPTYGYAELVDNSSKKVIHENQKIGKLLGTTFDNPLMPLIRYETGDEAYWTEGEEERLSNFRCVGEISGRVGEYLNIDGKKISVTGLIYGQHLPIFEISTQIQLLHKHDYLILFYVGKNNGSEAVNLEYETKYNLLDALDNKISVVVQRIDEPFRTQSGKMKILLDEDQFQDINEFIR